MIDAGRSLLAEKQLLDDLSKYTLLLGIVSGKTTRTTISVGLTNAELMFIHENGSPMRNMPSRPVLEMTIKWAQEKEFDAHVDRCIDGIMSGWTKQDVENELKRLCLRMERYARKIIYDNDGRLAANAPSVAKRKKGNHPLFDTGQLARSITCTLSTITSENS